MALGGAGGSSLTWSTGGPDVTKGQGIRAVTSMNWCDGCNLHVVVRMNFAVTYFTAYCLNKRLDVLVHVPSVHACERCSAESFQALG